jgi:hypothetical protein
MSALKASLDAVRAHDSDTAAAPAASRKRKAPAKKRAAAKAPARKAAGAKRAAAKPRASRAAAKR